MPTIQSHLRNTLLAGVFAVAPVAITVILILKVEEWTHAISRTVLGREIPFAGLIIALLVIYLAGLLVTISIGKYLLGGVDRLLGKVPMIKPLYDSWKQISFTSGGGEGMFAKVVLVPDAGGMTRMIGFTSGDPLPGDSAAICVFVPNAPNPLQGRLFFIAREKVVFTPLSSEEAFKFLLSTGNCVPAKVRLA
jgi:uncharacterized membrane protein